VLDVMNGRAVMVGWIFLTVGLIVGAIWLTEVQQNSDPRVQAMSLLDPKIFVVLLCWGVYTFELYARRAIGWSGRRAAWLSAIGFTILLLNFVPIGYFLTRSHNF
jgi:ABC-type transport system involved in cytochrome c biogenesis permease subunit